METGQQREVPGTGETADGNEEPRLIDTPELRKKIRKAMKDMESIDKKRADLNAEAEAIRANLEPFGVTRKGFNSAYQRFKLDDDKREAHDFSFALCCNSVGVGFQGDLFDENKTTKH